MLADPVRDHSEAVGQRSYIEVNIVGPGRGDSVVNGLLRIIRLHLMQASGHQWCRTISRAERSLFTYNG